MSVERYGNEHILPKSFINKMDENIKELSGSECISYNKPVVFPARFSDGHRCRYYRKRPIKKEHPRGR